MVKPEKRDHLSGDSCAFDSEGKIFCRDKWQDYSMLLHGLKGKKLNYLWLANNQLDDIKPIMWTANSFTIPDNNAENRAEKRKTLVRDFKLPKKNDKIKVLKGFDQVLELSTSFDLINIDSCNHFDGESWHYILQLLEGTQLQKQSYFFATYTKTSLRSLSQRKFPQYKRVASTREEIDDLLTTSFRAYGYQAKELEGFPITYESGEKKHSKLHSFGWELNKL